MMNQSGCKHAVVDSPQCDYGRVTPGDLAAFLRNGEWDKVERFHREGLSIHSDNKCRTELARFFARAARHNDALHVLKDKLSVDPFDRDLNLELGKTYVFMWKREKARRIFLSALLAHPDDAEILSELCAVDIYCHYWAEAKQVFARLQRFDSVSSDLFGKYLMACRFFRDDEELARQTPGHNGKAAELRPFHQHFDVERPIGDDVAQAGIVEALNIELFGVTSNTFSKYAMLPVDMDTPSQKVIDNFAHVKGSPDVYENTVYLLGFCFLGLTYEDSLAYYLQRHYNEHGEKVRVVSTWPVGFIHGLIDKLPLRPGDGVVLISGNGMAQTVEYLISFSHYAAVACASKNASFYSMLMPNLFQVREPSPREMELQALYDKQRSIDISFGKNFYDVILPEIEGKIPFIRCDDVIQRPHSMGEIFTDYIHMTRDGYLSVRDAVAGKIYSALTTAPFRGDMPEPSIGLDAFLDAAAVVMSGYATSNYGANGDVADYVAAYRDPDFSLRPNIGAIVMNCNPFTLGHRYLVETVMKYRFADGRTLDGLYIIAVQEDRSEFPFADRVEMIKKGVEDFGDGIRVIPSGDYIISSFSFPDYFTKETKVDKSDSTTDVMIFGSVIAPAFGIKIRFVGEEPNDPVTREYNETMKLFLPHLHVKVEEIKRVEQSGAPISASRVRKALRESDYAAVRSLVPDTTYRHLAALGRVPG